jgi:hypothetical protein
VFGETLSAPVAAAVERAVAAVLGVLAGPAGPAVDVLAPAAAGRT